MISKVLDPLSVPKRSRLYHLEPIAIGTPYVEGLISYICRLAEAHCVSPGILLNKEILPAFRQSYSIGFEKAYTVQADRNGVLVSFMTKPAYKQNPNEYGLLAWQYLEGLKLLTLRMDLQTLIIPTDLERVMPKIPGQELGRNLRAWCPECFQEWLTNDLPIYEPLLWSIANITVCLTHHQFLQLYCPHCQKAQRPLTARMYVARCSQCFNWLNFRSTEPSNKFEIQAKLDQQYEIAEQTLRGLSLLSNE